MNSNKLYIITILTILFAIKVFAQRSILIAVDMRELLEFHQDEKGTFVCSNSQIQKLNLKYKCVYAKKLKQNHPFNNLDLFSLKFNTEESTVKVLEEFNNIAMVSVAEDNAPITNEEVLGNSMLIVPNDPLYPQQLGPSYMNFPDAWEISTGNHSIKVAIFDTGLDWYHPDLIDNIYVNSGEINENTIIDWNNGIIYGDGLDNDGNGYIDDLVGWDFASNDNNPIHPPGGHAHGTQVSGPLCAVGNNGQHACGMAWNASVMGMRLEGDWLGNSIEAIDYCITQHFDVINMSYGAGWLNQTLFHNKIEQAYYEHNILFVSIAQNYNQSSPIYPGAWPEVFAMGAVDQYDQKAEYSNYGNWVDAVTVNYQHGMLGYADGEHWSMIWDGATSTSAPLTSGLAILIKSSYPEWTNEKIFNQILITTDNIDQVNPNYVGLLGTGRINALRALTFNGDINENLIWSKTLKIYHNIVVQAGKTLTLRDGTNLTFESGKTFNVYGNLVIEGDLTINQNIIIQPSGNIEIAPGATITFSNNSSLIINGVLTAVGTVSNKITFDFMTPNSYSQNGIKINSGGGINLSHAIIKNACAGITYNIKNGDQYSISNSTIEDCSNGIILEYGNKDGGLTVTNNTLQDIGGTGIKITNPGYGMNDEASITNNTFSNCTNGIYVYYASPLISYNHILEPIQNGIYVDASGQSPLLIHNEIKKSSSNPQYRQYQGIWIVNNSTAYLAHNDVQGFFWGIYCGGGSHGYFTDYSYSVYNPNNRFKDNRRGIAAAWGGYLLAGSSSLGLGYNSIYNNINYNAYIYQSSQVVGEVNFWGGGAPTYYKDASSSFSYGNYLTDDPWEEPQLAVSGSDDDNLYSLNKTSITNTSKFNIEEAIELERSGKLNEAVEYYKQMINEGADVEFALTGLLRLRNMYSIDGIKEYFENLSTTTKSQDKPIVLKLYGDLQLSQNNADAAISAYDNIIKTNNDAYSVTKAKFSKLFVILNIKKNVKAAMQILNEIKLSGVKEEDQLMLLKFAEYLINSTVVEKSIGNDEENNLITSREKPSEFKLLSNFPNPFNPSTTISYALPVESDVQITIFDLTGSIVKTFILYSQSAGYKAAVWDGRSDFGASVSSGIYIYTLRAMSLEGDGKSFTKSSKLMLLK